MKNILKLTLVSVALIISGSIFAQAGKKADAAKTEIPKTQITNPNAAPAPDQSGNNTEAPAKKNAKKSKGKEGKNGSKDKEAVSTTPTNPSGMAISENGVATPAKGKAKPSAAGAQPAAGSSTPAPVATPGK